MSTSAEQHPVLAPRPRRTVEELLAAKGTPPFSSVDELSANEGVSDPDWEGFEEAYRAERQQNQS